MKTNIKFELSDRERNAIACVIDGKQSKRLIQRKELIALCQQHVAGLVTSNEPSRAIEHGAAVGRVNPLEIADPREVHLMARPNDPSYVRGWNQAKNGGIR